MENETIENIDSTNNGEDVNLDNQITPEKYKALEEAFIREQESKTKLYARAKRAEDLLKVKSTEESSKPNSDPVWQEKMELKLEGYRSEEELEFIMSNGGKKGLEKPYVKAAIEAIRTQKNAEKAAIESSQDKSTLQKGYTDSELKNMSAAELYKILPKSDQ